MSYHNPISIEGEAGFRVLFECATISILVIGEEGNVELSNPCAERLFGYEPAELIGKPLEILIPESLRHRHTHHRKNYFDKPKARPMGLGLELYASKKNGEVFPVEISLGYYEFAGERLAVAFITDITDQMKAKKIITEREAWFRNMSDNSPVMIWVSGIDKQKTYFNNTWLQFTGRILHEELGNGWTTGIHPEDLERCLIEYSEAFDARRPFQTDYRLKGSDGHYRWIHNTGKPAYTTEHIFMGFIGSCTDIHDKKMATEELETLVRERTTELYETLNREKEMNELKSRFVSMASHEFRTPLSVVLSSTSLIEQYLGGEHDERVSKHLSRIKSNVGNLTGILNDFLSLDKLEQGKVDIEYEEFDFDRFIHEVAENVRPLKKPGQQILVHHTGASRILLDEKKMRYILVNLISNAIKYSPENRNVVVNSEIGDSGLRVVVIDQGIGIPLQQQKYMFDKFFRASNTGQVQGTGLGLTIVKRYVELLGGSIVFVSTELAGTTFTIVIPLPEGV